MGTAAPSTNTRARIAAARPQHDGFSSTGPRGTFCCVFRFGEQREINWIFCTSFTVFFLILGHCLFHKQHVVSFCQTAVQPRTKARGDNENDDTTLTPNGPIHAAWKSSKDQLNTVPECLGCVHEAQAPRRVFAALFSTVFACIACQAPFKWTFSCSWDVIIFRQMLQEYLAPALKEENEELLGNVNELWAKHWRSKRDPAMFNDCNNMYSVHTCISKRKRTQTRVLKK